VKGALWGSPITDGANTGCHSGLGHMARMSYSDSIPGKMAYATIILPPEYASGGQTDMVLYYTTDYKGGSPQARWSVATSCRGGNESASLSFNPASAANAPAGDDIKLYSLGFSGVDMTGCGAGEMLFVRVMRDSADAGDTMDAVSVSAISLQILYKVTH
jgi:hypothetical protein